MRKTTLLTFVFTMLPALVALAACTRNNGNIGKQFGQWKVTDISIDGAPADDYAGNLFWSFQNTTVQIKYTTPHHETVSTFGNYRIDDETLFVTFPDDDRPPLPGLGLKPKVQNEIQIVKLTHNRMVLAYDAAPGDADAGKAATVVMHLTKW